MSVSALPRSSPGSQSVDPAGILAFLDTLESAPDIEMHSLMIIRHGQVVAEGWWSPYLPEQPHLLYSLSKSFTATAAAFAIAEGLLDLDATVLSYFPELDAEITTGAAGRSWCAMWPRWPVDISRRPSSGL